MKTNQTIEIEKSNPLVKKYYITFNDRELTVQHHFIYKGGTVKTIEEPRNLFENRRALLIH